MKTTIQNIKIIVLGLIVAVGVSYAGAAWTPAPSTPPNANADAPLNVGSNQQTKLGSLLLGGLGVGGDFTYLPTGVSSVTPGQVLVAANASGKVAWGNPAATTASRSCVTVDTGPAMTSTGDYPINLLVNGRNICADDDGCTISIWSYTTAYPAGSAYFGSAVMAIRQASNGQWIFGHSDEKGIQGNGTSEKLVDSWGPVRIVDDKGVYNTANEFVETDNQTDEAAHIIICD